MHSSQRRLRGALVACLAAAVLLPTTASADDTAAEGGWGALAALSTLVYGPVKVVYAGTGLIIGGIAYGLSGGDPDVLSAVITPAVRGDYVVTPSHIRMERGLEFFGRDPQYRPVDVAADPPPPITVDESY